MRIYLLTLPDAFGGGAPDSYDAHVVAAESEQAARQHLDDHGPHGDETRYGKVKRPWLAKRTTCEDLGAYNGLGSQPRVILSSFNAG